MLDVKLDAPKIKSRREELGLSQEQAARSAGVGETKQAWSLIESGKVDVRLSTLGKIAAALQCDPRDIIRD